MYTFEIGACAQPAAIEEIASPRPIPRVVYWIGLSSLLADISSEAVASALPVFLFSVLQLSPLETGFLDGLYQGGAALVRVVAGYIADRRRHNRAVAFLGYALSVASRVGLMLSVSFGMLLALLSLLLDRIGKGIRTAPRDAIIAGHTPPESLGAAFGVHRSMDAAGALIGPLLGAALLWWFPFRFDWLFGVSLFFGIAGLVVFGTRVLEPVRPTVDPSLVGDARQAASLSFRTVLRMLLGCAPFVHLTLLAVVLSTFTISDGLVYLSLQREVGFNEKFVPLMFGFTALIFLLAAVPFGRLADRVGLVPLFLAGYGALAFVYLWFAFGPHQSPWLVGTIVGVMGLHYAATDGVLAATAVRSLDPRIRTTGLAMLATAVGLTRIASSSLYGWVWQRNGQHTAVLVFSVGMTCCCVAACVILQVSRGARSLELAK
jgi:MFS family permease